MYGVIENWYPPPRVDSVFVDLLEVSEEE